MDVRAGRHYAEGHACGYALGHADDVGDHVEVFDAEPFACPSHACLNLVGREQYAVLVKKLLELREVAVRGHDVAALSLDGLSDEHRHLLRGHVAVEQVLVDVVHARVAAARALEVKRAPVAVRVEDVLHARDKRRETRPLVGLARREADGPQGPAVEAPYVGEIALAARVPARHLHGRLDALCAAVAVEELLLVVTGHEVVQLLA